MLGITKPVFGFVGVMQQCNDFALAAEVARRRPDWSFVFIGYPLPSVDISMLYNLPNVHMLGAKPQREVVCYLATFDVCLHLYKNEELSKHVSSMKFYEYLATGRAIVTTMLPQQVHDYADVIFIGDGADEFEKICEAAISDNTPERIAARRERAKLCSWEARIAEIREKLAKLDILQ